MCIRLVAADVVICDNQLCLGLSERGWPLLASKDFINTSGYMGDVRRRPAVGVASARCYLCFTNPAEPVAGMVEKPKTIFT
ncbi:hypothetical protein DW701_08130 [Bacteroides eggerthii]|uniref:Uncharacterized protein n=1 Tax=Bacteroides eggerthii TaxID=28111 RepID=A0A414MDN0_9BACE|nr:hypothetical protein DW701_08130 [Bacteroides eggerthii]